MKKLKWKRLKSKAAGKLVWGDIVKVNAKYLQRLITEELALFTEGCGEAAETGHECPDCASGHGCGCDDEEPLGDFRDLNQTNISPDEAFSSGCTVCGGDHDQADHPHHDVIAHGTITGVEGGEPDDRLLTKDEALRVVAAIAQNTSCPVTRDTLMSVVDDLSAGEGEEWSLEDEEQDSDSAFGAGLEQGSEERDQFSYTGDLPSSQEDASGLGYSVGLMGLDDENRSGG